MVRRDDGPVVLQMTRYVTYDWTIHGCSGKIMAEPRASEVRATSVQSSCCRAHHMADASWRWAPMQMGQDMLGLQGGGLLAGPALLLIVRVV